MSVDIPIKKRISESDVLDKTEADAKKAERRNEQMITRLRQASQIGMALVQTTGGVLDQTYGLMIEAAFLTLELSTSTTTALALTGDPTAIAISLARVAAISSILYLVSRIESGRTENLQQTQAAVSMFRMLTFR